MKWFPRFGPADGVEGLRRNVELVRALRESVGADVQLMIDAFAEPVLPRDGYIYPPQRPGLGMDFDESKIESRRELTFE